MAAVVEVGSCRLVAFLLLTSLLSTAHGLSHIVDRRSLIQKGAVAGLAAAQGWFPSPDRAGASTESSSSLDQRLVVPKNKAVLVLGSNGGTGQECVRAVLAAGRPCIATTRSGNLDFSIIDDDSSSSLNARLRVAAADVSSLASVSGIISSSAPSTIGAVIFAASTGTKGGDAFAVDRDGVINTAKACISANIPRLVVVSSGTVTRPDSAVYKLLNFAGKGIMEAKLQGENGMRELYAAPDVLQKNLGYTVIRPGGLTTGESVGAAQLELNQGDNKSGRLPRADVAALCVQSLDAPDAFDATFECYEANTAKPVESVGFSNILKSTDATAFKSGRERQGATWETLFQGLDRDEGHTIA